MTGGIFMNIDIRWDEEAKVWFAVNEKLGLALESESYDALIKRVKCAIPELAELNNIQTDTPFYLCTERQQVVCA